MAKTRIKELCKEKKIRQIDLAHLLDMREDSFSIAVNNDTLSLSKLEKIAEHLGVGLADLFPQPSSFTCPNCGSKLKLIKEE